MQVSVDGDELSLVLAAVAYKFVEEKEVSSRRHRRPPIEM